MSLKTTFRQLLLILFTSYCGTAYSQTDYEFWFAAPEISYAVTAPPPFDTVGIDRPIVLVISTSDGPAIVRISQPADPNFQVIIDTLQTDQIHQVNLTAFIESIECKPANTVLNTGLLITSTKPINAVYEIQNRINSEGYTLKGMNALGNEFLIPAQDQYSNYPYCDPPARNSISIVASEDETTVKIVPTKPFEGHPGLDTIFVLLDRGQAWTGRAVSGDTSAHLGGTFVFSNKPVAVTVTDDAVRPDNASGLSIDIAGDQLIPADLVSNEYLAFSIFPHPGAFSKLYIYAFENGTSVTIDGTLIGVINRGEVIKYGINSFMPYYIQSNLPVEVYVFHKNNILSSEVAGEIIPPITCAGSYKVTFARTGPFGGAGDDYHIRILCKTIDCGNFTCSDPEVQSWLIPANFFLLPSTGNLWGFYGYENFSGVQMTYSNSTGNFQISTQNVFAPGALRSNIYTNFSGLNLGPDRTLCPGDTLLLDAGYGNYQYLWSTGATSRTINVRSAGTYWVQKTSASCTLSDTIVVTNLTYIPINLGADTSLCFGDSLKLDAGPGKSWYQWSTGQTTRFIYVRDSGTYWVTVPVSPCNFTDSDTIHVSRISAVELGPDRAICPGDSVLLDAGSGMNSYLWNTGASTQTIWVKNLGKYTVTVVHGTCHFSDSLMVSFNPIPSVNLGVDTNICLGQTYTFDAGFCAGCTYSWDNLSAGQMNIGTNQTYTTGQAGIYRVTVTNTNDCSNRDTVQLFTNAGVPVTINITSSLNNVCMGSSVTFSAHTTNGGASPTFQWKVNGVGVGTNDSLFTYVPSNNDLVNCIITSSNIVCISNNPATSNSIVMVVNPNLAVSITISPDADPVCTGSTVTFIAYPIFGGITPSYQWKLNGANAGTNNTFYSFIPNDGDLVSCVLTSSETCTTNNPASSIQHQVSVSPLLPVSITISPSANPFCPGSSVTFTATPIHGGFTPSYQWKVNGTNAGTDSQTFTYNPANNDQVFCILTSSETCTTGNPASSITITMVENNSLPAGVSITATSNPFCPGSSVTFTATPTNGGGLPVYQWKVNGINVGTNSTTYSYNPADGDSVRCIMTSNLSCVTGNPVSSAKIIMSETLAPSVSFTSCFDTITTINAKSIKLKGGIPLGGTYSGPGVNSITGVFTPSAAGTGIKTITYSYTNAALCSASRSRNIIVQPAPVFACGNNLTDIRDNKVYSTVHIGSQCWLASNLNYGSILASSQDQRDNCVAEKYCYNDNPMNCTNLGGLYQWDELMLFDETPADQGFCPPGWHIPTENEWNTLFANFTNNAFAGSPLKYSGYSGFNALLTGARHINKDWDFQGFATFFWSSTPLGSTKAWAHGMNDFDPSVSAYPASRVNAFSVRCLKD
jgi:uncharacterized protein (TIGR02145 family)